MALSGMHRWQSGQLECHQGLCPGKVGRAQASKSGRSPGAEAYTPTETLARGVGPRSHLQTHACEQLSTPLRPSRVCLPKINLGD